MRNRNTARRIETDAPGKEKTKGDNYMKQLGNLAIVCAKRPDVLLQVHNGIVSVHVGSGPSRASMQSAWENDETISGMIRELNFGRYRPDEEHERRAA